jgi:hypothetical protein
MSRSSKFLLAAIAVASLCLSAAASAQQHFYDPPGRVARITDARGDVVYSPAGDGEWYSVHRNRPLVRGDALWSDRGARAELQVGSTWLRMDGETSVEFLELSDRMLQVEVAEGAVNLRIRRLYAGQRVEIDTPNLAVVLDRPGTYRIDVNREGDHTAVEVREGGGLVYGTGGRFPVRRGDLVVFYGEDIRDYEIYSFPAPDNFDRYARMRDQRIDQSPSLRYVNDDLVGFSDFDDYGRWSRTSSYGNVWFPSNVYAGWAPYQDGQWVWQEPFGWTWVDDEPWGFASSHYGRWAWIDGRWGWIPGGRESRSVYAPALVAFMEGVGNSIGWFPLGPGDIYYPSYSVSPTYFNSVNRANTMVASANVSRAYSSYGRANSVPLAQAQGNYRNRTVATAVTTVPKDVFTSSRPVRAAQQRGGEKELLGRGEMRRNLGVRPGAASVQGAAPRARVRPPRAVEEEQVFVRNAPPAQAAAPSATATPAPAPAVREHPRRVRAITEQAASADARASGPRLAPGEPAAAATAGKPQALDREALQRERSARRQERQQQRAQKQSPGSAPAPAVTPAPAATAAPAAASTPAATPAPTPSERANRNEARQNEEARAAAEKARAEKNQAMEAQRKAEQEKRQAERAEREATQQRDQAKAQADAQQQREAADADAKAQQERAQARAAEREAQRQQRESERAQRDAAQQQLEAKQAGQAAEAAKAPAPAAEAAKDATPAAAGAPPARGQQRECVPAERIEAMRKRGVPEERIAELKVCPVEAPAQQ